MSKSRNNHIIRLALIALIIVLWGSISVSPAHAAGGSGRISGHLLDGSNKNAPLAGQQVTLQTAQGTNAQDLAKATTDAQGGFLFENLATDKTISYAVYIRYQGAHYVTDPVTLDSNPAPQLDLVVYQATSSTDRVFVGQMTALIREPNIEQKIVTISEIFTLSNLSTKAYVGSLKAAKGMPNALRFSLPQGARNIKLGKGFDGYQVVQVDRGFASDAAVLPGDNEFSFSYEIPYDTTKLDLRFNTVYPTLALSFMVPPDIHFSSKMLATAGSVNSDSDQRPYNLFKAEQLPANREISFQLEGLTMPEVAAPLTLRPELIWLLLALGVMFAILALTWFYLRSLKSGRQLSSRVRSRKGSSRDQSRKSPAKSGPNKSGTNGKQTAKPPTTEEREQALLQELLELDRAHEAGKLEKPVYEERRKKIKARLRTVLREKEALKK